MATITVKLLVVIFTVLACLSSSAWAVGDERLALIVGNASYKSAPLSNTISDADGMANLLRTAGFKVDLHLDTSQEQFRSAVAKFGEQIKDTRVKFGIFYYAGHGLQLNARNFLIPVNANIKTADDVTRQAVDVTDLLRYMEQAKDKSLIVILDACRDDPFSSTLRSANKGLSPYNAPVGTLLAYATGPGQVALDGTGKNGLYTKYLLQELAVPGESLLDGFMRVRVGVMTESHGHQVPWELSSLIDRDLYLFAGEHKRLGQAERVQLDDQESNAWQKMRSSANGLAVEEVAKFLRSYPNGITAEQAQFLLKRLWSQELQRDNLASGNQALKQNSVDEPVDAAKTKAKTAESQKTAVLQTQADQDARQHAEAQRLEAEKQAASKAAKLAETARLSEQRAIEAQLLAQAQIANAQAAQNMEKERQLEAARVATQRAKEQAQMEEQARLLDIEQAKLMAQATKPKSLPQAPVPLASATLITPTLSSELPATPYFQGSSELGRNFQVGDDYGFQIIDSLTHATKPLDLRVTAVDVNRNRVEYNNAEFVSDLMGNTQRNQRGDFDAVRQFYPAELYVGKQWRTHFKQSRPSGLVYTFRYDLKVVGRERITVPAGTFDTYKIEARGFNMELGASLSRNIWVSPGISADIAHETIVRLRSGRLEQFDRQELVRYVPGSTSTATRL